MNMKARDDLRETGISWLGAVPSSWRCVPLWSLFRRVKRTGYVSEQLLSVYRDHGVIPKASRDDNFNKPSDDLDPYQLVEPGDLVINKMKAWQGSVAISNYRGIVSPAYFVFKAKHGEDSRFLHYLFRSAEYTAGYRLISKGIRPNQWDLEPQEHSRMPVFLPRLLEQTAIAALLDREIGKIDTLVEEQKRLIKLLKEKRQTVISCAVTKGLNPDVKMKDSGIEWLGEVPEHWDVKALKHVCALLKDGTHLPPARVASGIPLLSVRNIDDGRFGFRDDDSMISEESYAELCRSFTPQPNDVLLAIVGATLGKTALVSEDMTRFHIQRSLAVFRTSGAVQPAWLNHFFQSARFQRCLWQHVGYSAQPGIYLGALAQMRVPVPPEAEQIELLTYLRRTCSALDDLVETAEAAVELLQERRAALISAVVTGKIDVREMAETEGKAA